MSRDRSQLVMSPLVVSLVSCIVSCRSSLFSCFVSSHVYSCCDYILLSPVVSCRVIEILATLGPLMSHLSLFLWRRRHVGSCVFSFAGLQSASGLVCSRKTRLPTSIEGGFALQRGFQWGLRAEKRGFMPKLMNIS